MHLSPENILPYLICLCSKQSSFSNSFKCKRCGRKLEVEKGIINYKSTHIKSLIELESKNSKDWSIWRWQNFDFLSAFLLQSGKKSVIELGSGGAQFRELYNDQNIEYMSIDLEPYSDLSIQINLNSGIPIKENSVDIVIMNNFIEHFPDTFFILSESLRVLKKGGKVLACVPFLMQAHQVPYDYVRYTKDGLENIFARVGFKEVSVKNSTTIFETIFSIIQSCLSHVKQNNLGSRVKVKIIKVICIAIFSKLNFNDSDKFSIGFNVIAKKANY